MNVFAPGKGAPAIHEKAEMRYYPAFLDVAGKPCVVVGGGAVGARKARTLAACGAKVTVIDPDAGSAVREMAEKGDLQWRPKPFEPTDLAGAFLVMGATDDPGLNQQVADEAGRLNLLCNIADTPDLCNFILPSVVARGDLAIAVSTSGKSPAFAKKMRKHLEKEFGPEYARLLRLMGAIRKRLLAESHAPEAHKPLFEAFLESPVLELLAREDESGLDELIKTVFDSRFGYGDLKAEVEFTGNNQDGP